MLIGINSQIMWINICEGVCDVEEICKWGSELEPCLPTGRFLELVEYWVAI